MICKDCGLISVRGDRVRCERCLEIKNIPGTWLRREAWALWMRERNARERRVRQKSLDRKKEP